MIPIIAKVIANLIFLAAVLVVYQIITRRHQKKIDKKLKSIDRNVERLLLPEDQHSEITSIYLALPGRENLVNLSEMVFWVNNRSKHQKAIRELLVLGSKSTICSIDGYLIKRVNEINFIIDEVNDANYNFMLAVERGRKFKMWYATDDGNLFGGFAGIIAEISGEMELNRGKQQIAVLKFKAEWISYGPDKVCKNPINTVCKK